MKSTFGFISFFSLVSLLGVSSDPLPLENYSPVVIVNSTTLNANQVYFVAHGNDPNGIPCFLVPDSNGICSFQYPTPTGSPSSAGVSVLLSALPTATNTGQTDPAYLVYFPVNSSSRAYFSINLPMYLQTALNPELGILAISDSSVTSLTDPNYYTLYQDFEFGLPNVDLSNTQLYLNLSYVDYFCIPMHLATYSYPSNTQTSGNISIPSGFPSNVTMASVFSTTNNALSSKQTYPSWANLAIPYYLNPYTGTGTPTTYLRILAAKNSIALHENTVQFQQAAVSPVYFPSNYFQDAAHGPITTPTEKSYMQAVYDYYNTTNTGNPFYFEIYPAAHEKATYTMQSDPTKAATLTLKFTCATSTISPIYIDLAGTNALSTEKLLSGATWPFTFPNGTSAADDLDYGNEISKCLSGLFTVGHLPYEVATTSDAPFENKDTVFQTLSYYTTPTGYSNGPWFNVYDQVLHQQFVSKGSVSTPPLNSDLGLAYAYDFDDLLNMSGLVNGMVVQDQYGNPSVDPEAYQPYTVITLGSLSGTTIPDISEDTYSYPVVVGPASNGVSVSFSHYNGTSQISTPASASGNTDLGIVHVESGHLFQITFSFNSVNYTYDINLQRQIVTPTSTSSTYSATDAYFQGSVVFTVTSGPSFTINYISTPPPWPG